MSHTVIGILNVVHNILQLIGKFTHNLFGNKTPGTVDVAKFPMMQYFYFNWRYISVNVDSLVLPPTPPSSNNSDSDSCPSPQRSAPNSPVRQHPYSRQHHSSSSLSPCSLSPIGSSKYYNQPVISSQVIIIQNLWRGAVTRPFKVSTTPERKK